MGRMPDQLCDSGAEVQTMNSKLMTLLCVLFGRDYLVSTLLAKQNYCVSCVQVRWIQLYKKESLNFLLVKFLTHIML